MNNVSWIVNLADVDVWIRVAIVADKYYVFPFI